MESCGSSQEEYAGNRGAITLKDVELFDINFCYSSEILIFYINK
jgi:hypothetical protein